MKKQRRLTFQKALNKFQTTSENDNDSDEEITNGSESVFPSNCPPESASDCPLESDSASDGDELPPEEVLFDIEVRLALSRFSFLSPSMFFPIL